MSERKVLNKYYPPDFDPSKIPRLRLPKNRQYTVRIMAPCNMRCNTCGDYIARGKKFNARKETVEHEEYLGLKVFRFYFKCPRCMQEITFKTDPKNYDYTVEHGATPNFKALKLAEQQAIEEKKEKEEEERLNPMKLLENRTKASRREMENLEALEDIREMNQREVIINYDELFRKKKEELELELKRQEEEDERYVQSIFKVNPNENNDQEEIEQDEFLEEIDPDSYFKDREKPTTTTTTTTSTSSSSFNPVQNTNDCTNILRHQVVDNEDAGQKSINNNNNNNYNKKRKLIQNMIVVKKKSTTSNAQTTNEINSSTVTAAAAAASTIASLCNYSGSSESDGDN